MRKRFTAKPLVVLTLLFGLVVTSELVGQVQNHAHVKVPFAFNAGDKTLPGGAYKMEIDDSGTRFLKVQSEDGKGNSAIVSIVTRLSAYARKNKQAVVFDKVGDSYYLSEVWLPGHDGLQVRLTSEQHSHEVLKAKR